MNTLRISSNVYEAILDTVGKTAPECGGVLGAGADGIISEYYYDEKGTSAPNGYAPDVSSINEMLINDWMPRGILMVGIIHSHANGVQVPSCGDVSYGIRILQALDTVDRFYLPILTFKDNIPVITCFGIFTDPDRQYVCRKIEYIIGEAETRQLG